MLHMFKGVMSQMEEDGGVLRSNLQAVLEARVRGPLSLFVQFDDGYYVIVFLTGHRVYEAFLQAL